MIQVEWLDAGVLLIRSSVGLINGEICWRRFANSRADIFGIFLFYVRFKDLQIRPAKEKQRPAALAKKEAR
jgi:hypothetical protein